MSIQNKESIIIDIDGRIENILCLMYSFYFSKLELVSIILTYGVHSIETTKKTIQQLLNILNIEVKQIIIIECARCPLRNDCVEIPNFQEYETINTYLSEQSNQEDHVYKFEIHQGYSKAQEIICQQSDVTQICMTVTTSLVLLLKNQPCLHNNISKILVVGGALEEGNITPKSEFNFYSDPDSVKMLLNMRGDVVIFPQDSCNDMILDNQSLKKITGILSKYFKHQQIISALVETMNLSLRLQQLSQIDNNQTPFQNVVGILFILYPLFFELNKKQININTNSNLCNGQLLVGHAIKKGSRTMNKDQDRLVNDLKTVNDSQDVLLTNHQHVPKSKFDLVWFAEKVNSKVLIKRIIEDMEEIKSNLCRDNEETMSIK